MNVDTLEHQPFLAVNGVQTMSHGFVDLTSSLDDLQEIGVQRFRLSPHDNVDMVQVAATYRAVSEGLMDPIEAHSLIKMSMPDITFCSGYMGDGIACH